VQARADWAFSQLARADVVCPTSVDDLASAVASGRTPFAGGTDLLVRALHGDGRLPPLAWTGAAPTLQEIRLSDGGLHIGGAASAGAVAASPETKAGAPAVAEAAGFIGSVQIRTRATLAGNVCNASPAADGVPALVVHGTRAVLRRGAVSRRLKLTELLTGPGRTALAEGEILQALELTALGACEGSCYRRFTVRESMDLAFVGVAALVRLTPDGEAVERAALALGAVGPTVETAPDAEAVLQGREPVANLLRECGEAAAAGCHPIDDLRASAGYRRRLVAALVRETVEMAVQRARARLDKKGGS
jgi:CO/xanthine dehydrogenase FAD-binding subunit